MLLRLALLCLLVPPALSLECYVCTSTSTNDACNQNTQECQAPQDRCMTVVDILGLERVITKQCASEATCSGAAAGASVDESGNGNIVNCCNTFDLCNFSGAETVSTHTALITFLSAGVLFSMLSH